LTTASATGHKRTPTRRRRDGRRLTLRQYLSLSGVAIGMLLLAAACGPPTPPVPPISLPDSYAVADDFSPPDPRWARFDTDESAVYALAGELFLEDRGQGVSVYTPLLGERYADTDIRVDVRHVQGSVNNWLGILCRHQDVENYYLLAISADGYTLILRVVDGEPTPLVGPEYNEAIRIGKAENDLRVLCEGSSLSMWVNDELIATASDDTLMQPGDVALFADAVQRGEIVVTAFDNFVLVEP